MQHTIDHTPGAATGAEPATFATEGHQFLVVAGLTAHPEKAMLQTPAFEVVLELPGDIARQRSALQGHKPGKFRVVALD
jgi:hypothetical protein